jgi:hypothetical protein
MKETHNPGEAKGKALRESHKKVWDKEQSKPWKQLRESVRAQYGLDIDDPEVQRVLDISESGARSFRTNVYAHAAEIREANAEGMLGALLRVGAQTKVNSMYQAVPTNFEEIVEPVASNKAIEQYSPLFRAGFPSRTAEGEEPRRLGAQGMDIMIRNAKTAAIMEFTREMFADDQTNQIAQQPNQVGENAKIVKDAWCFQRWLGSAGTDPGGDVIPASQTGSQAGETTWPYNTSFANGGGQNRLTTYAAFGSGAIQQAKVLGLQMKDAKGQKMLVNPDSLVVGPALGDIAATLLNSEFYPATSSMKAAVSGGADSGIGTTYAHNVLKGRYNLVESRWLPSTAYGIMQAGRGLILQNREPLEVVQENPASGPAFSAEVFRFKVRERWEVDWIEPRFSILCSDGTV